MRDKDLPVLVVGDKAWYTEDALLYIVEITATSVYFEGEPDAFTRYEFKGSRLSGRDCETTGRSYLYKIPEERARLISTMRDRARGLKEYAQGLGYFEESDPLELGLQ